MRIKSQACSSQTIHEQQLQNAAFYKQSSIFNVQCFKNWPVHKFYGFKASQMSKVCASSHEYPEVEEIKLESL